MRQDHDDRYDNRRRDNWGGASGGGGGGGGGSRQYDSSARRGPPRPAPVARAGGGDVWGGGEYADRGEAAPAADIVQPPAGLKVGDALTMYVAERTMLGYNVELVDHDDFQALLFHASIYGPPPFVGDTIQGFVCNIRDDGKVRTDAGGMRERDRERERGSHGRPVSLTVARLESPSERLGRALGWHQLPAARGSSTLTHSLLQFSGVPTRSTQPRQSAEPRKLNKGRR